MHVMIGELKRSRRRALYCGAILCFAFFFAITPVAWGVEVVTEVRTCNISTPHPYAGWADLTWVLVEGGITACRVNFSRLKVEDGHDFVILNSSAAESSLKGNYPDGCWSEWIYGDAFTIRLTSNSYNTGYGFDAVKYEVQGVQAWETFCIVAIPIINALVVLFVIFEWNGIRPYAPRLDRKSKKKTRRI